MKQFVSITVNGFLFWRISRTTSVKHCLHQYGRYFSVIKPVQQEVFFEKPILNSKKKEKSVYLRKRFSSSTSKPFKLTDFEVWSLPKFEGLIRVKDRRNFYSELKEIDGVSATEFDKCLATALEVVTNLLAKHRFSELKGLLTSECEEEVRKNLQNWRQDEISFMAVRTEDITQQIVCDFPIFSDEKSKEKNVKEIRVIYYVQMKYSPLLAHNFFSDFSKLAEHYDFYCYAIYNCKFIKELSKACADPWRIKKINLKSM